MGKLRVLEFITPAGFYGAERWVIALANNSNYDKVICDLAVTQESPDQDLSVAEYYPKEAGEVHYLKMNGRFDFRAVRQLVDIIKKRNIQVIHTHGYKSDILGLLAARIAGIKCVSTPHGFSGNVGFKLGAFIRIGTFMLRYFDSIVPLSEELIADMKRFNVPEGKTKFIRNGVDLKEIDHALIELNKLTANERVISDQKIVGFIGQLIPRKGIGDLLDVFDKLHATHKTTCLQLLGDGRQREELQHKASQLVSVNSIQFLGFRSDRLALLSNFSLFVMTSSLEGIPRCMMEAMAVGIPIVAYDIPGVDQLVEHNVTGLLAPFGDKEALLEYCKMLLDDRELVTRLTENARNKIDHLYSAGRMAEEYELLFRDLIV